MADILHRVGFEATPAEKVYEALTTIDGLAGWWTDDTKGSTDVGGVIEFRFPPGGFDMQVTEQVPGSRVSWTVVDGPDEWVGTSVDWDLRQDGDMTILLFKHRGWREPVEFMHHCSTKWATYLISLKQLVETGKGAPSPRDLRIADFD
jgi:uncharacterized protein YndB with AHSA1/START domain